MNQHTHTYIHQGDMDGGASRADARLRLSSTEVEAPAREAAFPLVLGEVGNVLSARPPHPDTSTQVGCRPLHISFSSLLVGFGASELDLIACSVYAYDVGTGSRGPETGSRSGVVACMLLRHSTRCYAMEA